MSFQIQNTRNTVSSIGSSRRSSNFVKENPAELGYKRAQLNSNMSWPQQQNIDIYGQVYKTSREIKRLSSEAGKTLYADVFINDKHLGPLKNLCIAALAKRYLPHELPHFVYDNDEYYAIYYDNLSLDLPLEKCYQINADRYWKRFVLAKAHEATIGFREGNWKEEGISIKLTERLESYSAEYFPEDELRELSKKIKDFVVVLHLQRLKSLPLSTLAKNIDFDASSSSTSVLSTTTSESENSILQLRHKSIDSKAHAFKRALIKAKRKRSEARAIERQRSNLAIGKKLSNFSYKLVDSEEEVKPKAKLKKKNEVNVVANVFDIPITPPEYDSNLDILDRRNKRKYLTYKGQVNTSEDKCHHIDLRCLRFFPYLVTFSLQFLSSESLLNYHPHQLNISERDMIYLASGLSQLKCLKTFRLTHSRMNSVKLEHVTRSLKQLPLIEIIDFSCDSLDDNCGAALYDLFSCTISIKSLELMDNILGAAALLHLGKALKNYKGRLEYLGLSRNIPGEEGLHALYAGVQGTIHIQELNLCAASIASHGILCCIANEFILWHKPLRRLNMNGIKISPNIASEFLNALQRNYRIVNLDVRGCDLDLESEAEVNLLIHRNREIAVSPFIGNLNVSGDTVMRYMDRVKHPILIRALKNIEERIQLDKTPLRLQAHETVLDFLLGPHRSNRIRPEFEFKERKQTQLTQQSEDENIQQEPEYFNYDPKNINDADVMIHVAIPGPDERYYYLKNRQKTNFLIPDVRVHITKT